MQEEDLRGELLLTLLGARRVIPAANVRNGLLFVKVDRVPLAHVVEILSRQLVSPR